MFARTVRLDHLFSRGSNTPNLPYFLLLLPMLGLSQSVPAYDWNNDYGVSARAGYEDNYRLSESDELGTASLDLSVFANLERASEISSLRATLRANATNFSESEIDDSEGYDLALDASRNGERLSSNLNVLLASQSTTETELLDTGVVEDGDRKTVRVAPGIVYRIDERNSFLADYSATDVAYDTVSLTDYTDNALSFGWRHRLEETSELTARLRIVEYDPEDDSTTDTESIRLFYSRDVSERTAYEFGIGYSDIKRPGDDESGGELLFDFNHRMDERSNISIKLSSSYEASGAGEVRDENRFNLLWTNGLSERSQLSLEIELGSNDDRDYRLINLAKRYQYTQEVNLSASLRDRYRNTDSASADSFGIFFSINYAPI